jgi:hypothetical protein
MPNVHFYSLKRATPKFNAGERDDWSIPGALSPDEALRYFGMDLGFGLRRIDDDAQTGEFVLEERERIERAFSASTLIRPGDVVATFWVERTTAQR